jgi:hypothetical protein
MSDLPQADELPRAAEGYDPARVEEAFAAFGERVRELEHVAAELRGELKALRAHRAAEDEGDWPGDPGTDVSPDWVAAVPPPLARGRAFPRLVLEAAFLLLVALLAGLADLSTGWIVAVLAAAWGLVVLGEWASAARRARWHLDEIAPPLAEVEEHTGPWDIPVAAPTVIEAVPDPESRTVVVKPPGDGSEQTGEETGELVLPEEPEPAKRRRFWRRRAVKAGQADPWKA